MGQTFYKQSVESSVELFQSSLSVCILKMPRPGFLLFSVNLIPQILSDTNNTNFHNLTLERKEMKMLLLGQCEELHRHQHDLNFSANFLNHPKNGSSGKY